MDQKLVNFHNFLNVLIDKYDLNTFIELKQHLNEHFKTKEKRLTLVQHIMPLVLSNSEAVKNICQSAREFYNLSEPTRLTQLQNGLTKLHDLRLQIDRIDDHFQLQENQEEANQEIYRLCGYITLFTTNILK